ncbi:hypothetical protein OBBRIDRAFT_883239 [Obba rivulosa]|uniref:Uncharacterized protein n=1 Tax=Obba rivulosa TaxID=1052685 RepID=A0A8E2DVC8_9APHY|nr:hypothetical protein OBBRIDRAFT_883239 [Obba rivulosa]
MSNTTREREEMKAWFNALRTPDYDKMSPVPPRFAQPPRTVRKPKQRCASSADDSRSPPEGDDGSRTGHSMAGRLDGARRAKRPAAQRPDTNETNPGAIDDELMFERARETGDLVTLARMVANIIEDSRRRFPSSSDRNTASGLVVDWTSSEASDARAEKRARSSDRTPTYQSSPEFEKSVDLLDELARRRAERIDTTENRRRAGEDGQDLASSLPAEKCTTLKTDGGRVRTKRPRPL